MPQSSLMTWLNKPNAIHEPPQQILQKSDRHEATPPATPPENGSQPNGPAEAQSPSSAKWDLKPLPPNVELRSCSKGDIPHFKRLISLLLPIPYSDRFFRETIEDSLINDITMLAVWHDDPEMVGKQRGRLVGAIRCRLLAHPPTASQSARGEGPMLYLSTLALLSPYRNHGIATHLLHGLTKRAIENYGIASIGAHVWEANHEGLEWYRKRGFREVGTEGGYYRRLDPQTAVVMQRDVRVTDLPGK